MPSDTVTTAARVLIINDDAKVTETFSRILRLEGHEVWAAASPDGGLALAQTHRPHAVIVDLRIPLADALRVLRAVRSIPGMSTTPVAIVTGDYALGAAQLADIRALGAELRHRPVWLEELLTLGRELLALPVRD